MWGRDNIEGVTGEKLTEKLKELNLPSGYDGMQGTLNAFTRDVFHRWGNEFRMTVEAYFQLLEHERLEEARKDSRIALRVAVGSLIIASIIGILQIIFMAF